MGARKTKRGHRTGGTMQILMNVWCKRRRKRHQTKAKTEKEKKDGTARIRRKYNIVKAGGKPFVIYLTEKISETQENKLLVELKINREKNKQKQNNKTIPPSMKQTDNHLCQLAFTAKLK